MKKSCLACFEPVRAFVRFSLPALLVLVLLFLQSRFLGAQTPPCEPPETCADNPTYYCEGIATFYWAMIPDGQGGYNIHVRNPVFTSGYIFYYLKDAGNNVVATLQSPNGVFSTVPPECYTIVICVRDDNYTFYCCKELPCDFGDTPCCELSFPFFTDLPNPTWQFGDNTTSNQQTVRHEYTNINTYAGEGVTQTTVTLLFGATPIQSVVQFPPGIWVGQDCVDSGNSSVLQNSVNPALLVFPVLSYANRNISIKGSITMNRNYAFTNCDFCMHPSSRIVVSTKNLSFLTGTVLHEAPCENLAWYGVEVQQGTLTGTEATFTGAYNAVYTPVGPVGNPTYRLTSCLFNRNYLGIKVLAPTVFGVFADNTLGSGAGMLNWPPLEASPCSWVALIARPANPEPFAGIYAETPANQAVVSVDLPGTTDPNTFINLSNGIYLVDANTYVRRSRFENMLSGAYPNDDGFGIALFTNNIRSLEQLGLGKTGASTPLTFDNCRHAVFVNMDPYDAGGDVLIRSYNNKMNVDHAYTLLGGNSVFAINSVIQNNDIVFNEGHGIYVENASPASRLLITQNRIRATNTTLINVTGIALLNFLPPTPGGDFRVSVIDNSSAGFGADGIFDGDIGVSAQNFSSTLIERNTVEDFSTFGIYNADSPDNDLRCNEVASAAGLESVRNHNSANMLIEYNQTDDTDDGIVITSPCNNSIISCNQIGSHNRGLYYDAFSITGPQLPGSQSAGNIWSGAYGTWAAFNSNPNWTNSRYFYRTGEINPAQVSPTQWFTLVGSGVTCAETCPETQLQERSVTDLDIQIAEGAVDTESLAGYQLETALYRDLIYYPQLLQDNATLQNFYETYAATNGGILTGMDKAIADAFQLSAGQQTEWGAAQNALRAAFTAWAVLDSLVQTGEADPEDDDQVAERAALTQQILSAEVTLDALYAENLAMRVENAPGLLQTLESLTPQAQHEINLADLDALILATVFVGQSPSDDQIGQILQIAQQCSAEGGPAVRRARIWHHLLTGQWVEVECDGVIERGENLRSTDEAPALSLKISPNPAHYSLSVQVAGGEALPGSRLEITDVTGKLYWTAEMAERGSSVEIRTDAWSNGVYFCSLKLNGVVVSSTRFSIQH